MDSDGKICIHATDSDGKICERNEEKMRGIRKIIILENRE
jgi:hypothetical protein